MSSSIGMMTFPIYGKIENVPNHQPVNYIEVIYGINVSKYAIHGASGYRYGPNYQL